MFEFVLLCRAHLHLHSLHRVPRFVEFFNTPVQRGQENGAFVGLENHARGVEEKEYRKAECPPPRKTQSDKVGVAERTHTCVE